MSVLVYAESVDGKFKKSTLEAVSYAKATAAKIGGTVTAVSINANDDQLNELGKYGADKVLKASLGSFNPANFAQAVAEAANNAGAKVVVVSQTYTGKSVAPRVAARLNAGIVSGAIAVPNTDNGFSVKKSAFSNKAFAYVEMTSDIKVIMLIPNSIELTEHNITPAIEDLAVSANDNSFNITNTTKAEGKIILTEAELVVSAGRGMKGPENWGMIEELAETLEAATACSKPVSDMDWRPHSEHVGQTGITIKPNLYIAVGISGAIQHLAGVSASKVICVINKDPEAPFFKNADYGIVGDAFEVVPKLIEAAKSLKAN